MDHYLSGIILAYCAFILGLFSPGPNIIAVIGTSMNRGRTAGKALALGIANGSFIWGCLTLFGITTLLVMYAWILTVIKVFGAVYLLWLAIKAFRSAATAQQLDVDALEDCGGIWGYYRRGLIIQLTNPKAALTWIAIMSLVLDANAPYWVGTSVVLGTAVISIIGHLIYALAFSTDTMVNYYRRCRRWIETGLGLFFCFASYKIITSKTN